jgi:hypothetical protein
MRPIHPGEVLKEDFLQHLGLKARQLKSALMRKRCLSQQAHRVGLEGVKLFARDRVSGAS